MISLSEILLKDTERSLGGISTPKKGDEVMVTEETYDDPPDDLEDLEETEVGYLVGSCSCNWRGSGMFFQGDQTDLKKAGDKLLGEHAQTGCARDPSIGVM